MDYLNTNDLFKEASKYENVSSLELVNLFKDAHIFFPDFINRFIILNVSKKHILDISFINTLPPEFQYKLKNFNYFSNYLLISSITKFGVSIESKEYKNMFMRFYLKNQKKFKITQAFEKSLEEYKNKKGPTESIIDTIKTFQELFYTPKGYLDGINLQIVKDAITQTFNVQDIIELSKLNGVEIPKRLNKQELLSIISSRLLLTDEEKELISKKPVTDICLYSKQKGFKISPDLKKSEMVEYLIYSLGKYHEDTEKDLYNYDILVKEDDVLDSIEQESLELTNDNIPVSSNLIDHPDIEIKDEIPPIKEEIASPKKEDNEEVISKVNEVIDNKEIKETKEISGTLKEDMENVIYYDTQVDQEIRDIIKKYYSKKKNKDKVFRIIVVILLSLILVVSVILLLKSLKLF